MSDSRVGLGVGAVIFAGVIATSAADAQQLQPQLQASRALPPISGQLGNILGGINNGNGIDLGDFRPGFGHCAAITLDACQNPKYFRTLCGFYNHSACMSLIQTEFQNQWTNAQGTSGPNGIGGPGLFNTILPESMPRHSGILLDAAIFPYDQSTVVNSTLNTDHTYASFLSQARVAGVFGALEFERVVPLLTPLHDEFEYATDGFAISNVPLKKCAEYAYKKHYDYNRFEDAVASCKHDIRCIADVAVMTTNPGIGMRTMRSLAPATVPSLDPDTGRKGLMPPATTVQLPKPAPASQPKNVFFGVNKDAPGDPDTFVAKYGYWIERAAGSATRGAIEGAAASAAPYVIPNRWDWHVQMHDTHAAYAMTLTEYRDIERRATVMQTLYESLRDDERSLTVGGGFTNVAKILTPFKYDRCGTLLSTLPPKPGCAGIFNPDTAFHAPSKAAALLAEVKQLGRMLATEWNHLSVIDGTTVDHGCLDVGSARCDWTPKLIATEYANLHEFQKAREEDYRTCIQKTGNTFTDSMAPPYDILDSDTGAFVHGRNDVYQLEHWFAIADKMRSAEAKDLHWRYDDPDFTPPAEADADSTKVSTAGDDTPPGGRVLGSKDILGASYSYSSGWKLPYATYSVSKGLPTDGLKFCHLGAEFGGALSADVWTFGEATNLMTATLRASASAEKGARPSIDANVSFTKLFGDAVAAYEALDGGTLSDTGFHLVPANLSHGAGTSIVVVIGAVPVTLTYNVELAAGIAFDVTGTDQDFGCNDATAGGATPPAHWSMTGSMGPYVKAVASVSGALGAEFFGLGAEAGIEGDVTLIQAGIPLSTTLAVTDAVTLSSGGVSVPAVSVKAESDLEIRVLDGDVKAYVEVCFGICRRAEKQIYHWNGFDWKHPLFTPLDKSFALTTLANVARPPHDSE